ncbi:hypothetical protein SADUNF_Sadunf18G0028200 [Salix dunnii]|uniref:Pentatricopeptide repeat-containing protein n=1 Tax=Salix dunnii TaxID=1413687 RepID=A0A835MD98_9ROSI|nr:hypothetical protein SADUNF_Sadunf18G0028200 [Salix dunnii]
MNRGLFSVLDEAEVCILSAVLLNKVCFLIKECKCTERRTGFDMEESLVGNSFTDMFSNYGRITEAARLFEVMLVRNLVSWNAVIAGYTIAGFYEKALVLFRKNKRWGEVLDEFTASRKETKLMLSRLLVGYCILLTLPLLVQTSQSILNVYLKCGMIKEAEKFPLEM